MRITLTTDLWLYEEDGVTLASEPWIKNAWTGEGCPGIAAIPVKVVRKGTVLDVTVARMADG